MIFKIIDSFEKINYQLKINGIFSRLLGKLFGPLNVQIKLLWFMALPIKMAKASGNKVLKDFILKGLHLIINLMLALCS